MTSVLMLSLIYATEKASGTFCKYLQIVSLAFLDGVSKIVICLKQGRKIRELCPNRVRD